MTLNNFIFRLLIFMTFKDTFYVGFHLFTIIETTPLRAMEVSINGTEARQNGKRPFPYWLLV